MHYGWAAHVLLWWWSSLPLCFSFFRTVQLSVWIRVLTLTSVWPMSDQAKQLMIIQRQCLDLDLWPTRQQHLIDTLIFVRTISCTLFPTLPFLLMLLIIYSISGHSLSSHMQVSTNLQSIIAVYVNILQQTRVTSANTSGIDLPQ